MRTITKDDVKKLYLEELQKGKTNEKDYKFNTCYGFGSSDYARLIIAGIEEDKTIVDFINFGIEISYKAYFLCDEQEVPNHYEKVKDLRSWVKFYDDDSCVCEIQADKIEIYRAGDTGLLIKLY